MKKLALIILALFTVGTGKIWAQNNLWDVQYADANTVYAYGDNGTILKSANGGVSWGTLSSGTTQPLLGGSFTSSGVGSIVGGDVLNGGNADVRTLNGSNWSSQAVPTTRVLTDVAFLDGSNGFVSGFWGTILKTANGGASWQAMSTGTVTNFHGVSFVNTSLGVAVGDYGLVMRTSDGGATWASRSGTTTNNLRDIDMVNSTFGVAVGFAGKALRTNDGGNTWSLMSVPTTGNLASVSFVDASTGYIAGAAGVVLKTTDGGNTWVSKNAMLANWYGVAFQNATTGIVVGDGGGVIARTTDGGNSWTRITDFSGGGGGGGTAPVAPALASPASGSIGQPASLTLAWNASSGATSYRLQVSAALDFSSLAYDNAALTTTSATVSGLASGTLYYWRVSASNAYGTSPYSSTWNFATAVAPPPAPVLASPANGATGQLITPTLAWNTASGATSYRLQVSTSSTFSTFVYDNASLTSLSAALSGLAYSTPYYWRVSASNSGGTSAFSAAWSFVTMAAPVTVPPVPTLVSPANAATGQPVSLTLSWNASSGATAYHLQVSTSSTFSTLFYDNASLTSTSAAISGLAYSTTYYWHVSASNSAGASAYSGAWSYGTTSAPVTVPPVPTLVSPANGATGQPVSLTLSWNASSGATAYHLQVSTSSTFSTLFYDNTSLTSTSAAISGLAYSTTYYWHVSASNSAGASAYSGAWSYGTTSAPVTVPPVPTLVSPANGATGQPVNITLAWNASSGATAYHLQVSASSTFSTLFYDNAALTTTSAAVNGLGNSTTYYWRVSASNSAGSSAYSGGWSFVTASVATAPSFAVTPTSINFGTVKVGAPKIDSVTVSNSGTANLVVSSVTSSSTMFVASPTSGTVAPGGSKKFYITYTPTNKTTQTATITFAHNAAGSPGTVSVTGKGGTARAKFARVAASGEELPTAYAIEQNYPNPFNPTTTIAFALVDPSEVRLTVYNSIGQEVATLVNGELNAGEQSVQWNATTGSGEVLPSGAYFYRIEATSLVNGEQFQSVKRMVLMK